MATLNLSGTPAVRYPDPIPSLFQPNGTFLYSAYDAKYIYYDPRPDDPTKAGYSFILSKLPVTQSEANLGPLSAFLFCYDYPALIQTVSVYVGDSYNNGALYSVKNPTFDESTLPVLGTTQTNFPLVFANGNDPAGAYKYIVSTGDDYKRILSGNTPTNNIPITGYSISQNLLNHGLYDSAISEEFLAPITLTTRVVCNAPVISSPTAFTQIKVDFVAQNVAVTLRQPVILWEPDLTQEIVDNGYIIYDNSSACGPIELQVVGIWAYIGYSPLYVPPQAPAPKLMALADDASQPATSPISDPYLSAKNSLIEMAASMTARLANLINFGRR